MDKPSHVTNNGVTFAVGRVHILRWYYWISEYEAVVFHIDVNSVDGESAPWNTSERSHRQVVVVQHYRRKRRAKLRNCSAELIVVEG